MKFYENDPKDKKKREQANSSSSYLMDTPDPDKLTPTGTFMKDTPKSPEKSLTKTDMGNSSDTKDMDVRVSENLSEISANDYGLFTLKIKGPEKKKVEVKDKDGKRETLKRKKTEKGDDTAIKYNLVKHLGESRENLASQTHEKIRLCKNRTDLIAHLAKEENEYTEFDVVNVDKIVADIKRREAEFKEKVI